MRVGALLRPVREIRQIRELRHTLCQGVRDKPFFSRVLHALPNTPSHDNRHRIIMMSLINLQHTSTYSILVLACSIIGRRIFLPAGLSE
eukprot:4379307-Amphidinium_carterae.1